MRSFIACLIAVGIFVGVVGRAAAHAGHSHEGCGDHHHEMVADLHSCCDDQEAASHGDCNHSEVGNEDAKTSDDPNPDQPEHQHHHHICCSVSPLIADNRKPAGFIDIDGVRIRVLIERSVAPEEPVFELDMPPLI